MGQVKKINPNAIPFILGMTAVAVVFTLATAVEVL
jgi:hypothetical protein